jgi:hypothetical protein
LVNRAALEQALRRDLIADAGAKAGVMTAFAADAWLRRFSRSRVETGGVP